MVWRDRLKSASLLSPFFLRPKSLLTADRNTDFFLCGVPAGLSMSCVLVVAPDLRSSLGRLDVDDFLRTCGCFGPAFPAACRGSRLLFDDE